LTSVLDILINEIANVLGISAAEVKSKFTDEQLNDLLNLSLCEPNSDAGVPLTVTEPPCEEPTPNLLPPIEVKIKPSVPTSNVEQCIEKVAEVNKQIADQNEQYSNYRLLLDKLIEYRDNYGVLLYYFEERSKEAARILGIFEPILTEIRKLRSNLFELERRADFLRRLASASAINFNLDTRDRLLEVELQIDKTRQAISDQTVLLSQAKAAIPVFSDENYKKAYSNLSAATYGDTSISAYLADLYNGIISNDAIKTLRDQLEDYSGCIKATIDVNGPPESIQEAVERNYFSFTLEFPQLGFIKTEKEKFNENTGEDYTEDTFFFVKNNPLLQKNSFFFDYSVIRVTDFSSNNSSAPTGTLYEKYYNLFEDPENNFFTLYERGLSASGGDVDPKLRDSTVTTKKEKNNEYYIRDFEVMSEFYKNFDERFESKKEQRRAEVIVPIQNSIRFTMQSIARQEIQLLLAISGVADYLPSASTALTTVVGKLRIENNAFAQRAEELDSEINRIQALLPELKPTPQKIKELLKEKSPECFSKEPEPVDDSNPDCQSAKSKLGIDPFFTETLNGCDPTLPNQNQICYWVEFSKIASVMGLLPLPNIPNSTKLRYWPVGLLIPSPTGLIKIPLPIIWIPIVAISTPLGNVVIFLTVNGIFISPVVFFVSSSGFKQHILTVKGSSKKFGYTAEDASIKSGIQAPAFLLAAKDKANRLAQEATGGKYVGFSEKEKAQILQQKNILGAAESAANANNNTIRKAKVAREKKNFERATTKLSDSEKLVNALDKLDSVKDVIDDAKRAILNRIDELGRPVMEASNSIKERIASRKSKLLSELQESLELGDLERAAQLRTDLQQEGMPLEEKINALEKDLMKYFDRIDFPKVTIPKDASTIDPKLNSITEFLSQINEFASVYKTQFYSKDDSKVRRILSIQLAKSKQKIKETIDKKMPADGSLNIEKDLDKIKKLYRDANKKVIDAVSGKEAGVDPSSQKTKVDELKSKVEKETDQIKKIKLKKQLEKEQVALSNALENERVKQALALTPKVLTALSKISVDFNPFAACCNKKSFELGLDTSPALVVFESAKKLLDSYVNSLSTADLRALFGGKLRITSREMVTAYLGIVKGAIPSSLEISLPNLNLLTFANSFSGLLTSLFEVKVPNVAAQPALPKSITIDLNILKKPLASLLLSFLKDSLPDPSSAVSPISTSTVSQAVNQTASTLAPGNEITSATSQATSVATLANSSMLTKQIIDRNIQIVNCEPDTSQASPLAGGSISPNSSPEKSNSPETSNSILQPYSTPTASAFSSGNVIVNSSKDILPNFSTLDTDFMSVNPADLIAILKNFIDLKFEQVENLLDPFYTALSAVKGIKGVNLNLLEETQYKAPPYGPPSKQIFNSITALKKQIPKSATIGIIDTDAVKQGAQRLKSVLGPIANSPLPAAIVAGAGATDSALPATKVPSIDSKSKAIKTKDVKAATFALRSLHPLLTQEDLPPWERLTGKNLLFLLFLDEFISNGADKVGFFRAYL